MAFTTVGICLGTVAVVYIYVVAIGGAASGLGAVKQQIVIGGLIAAVLALIAGIYYATLAASNVRRLQAAARKVAQSYSVAASNWRKAAERANSDDPISRDMAEGNAQDGAHFEAHAHQLRHELDGTPIPAEAAAYPTPAEDK